jgi:hypothetical protein
LDRQTCWIVIDINVLTNNVDDRKSHVERSDTAGCHDQRDDSDSSSSTRIFWRTLLPLAASMRPARRLRQAEDVARKMKVLLSSPIISQLLQHSPPAALTAEQEAQLSCCCDVINQLAGALNEAPSLRLRLVDAMLKQQAGCSIGSVVAWVQQQPEQQLLNLTAVTVAGHQGSVPKAFAAGRAPAATWAVGVDVLRHFAVEAAEHNLDSAGACSLAANLTQQLDQSGKACSCSCTCTAVAAATRHACM